jgi:hypothetical protein
METSLPHLIHSLVMAVCSLQQILVFPRKRNVYIALGHHTHCSLSQLSAAFLLTGTGQKICDL